MLMLTCEEWMASREAEGSTVYRDVRTRQLAFVSNKPLRQAMQHLVAYRQAYVNRYTMTVLHFRLLSVATIPDKEYDPITFAALGVDLIETLPIIVEEFNRRSM